MQNINVGAELTRPQRSKFLCDLASTSFFVLSTLICESTSNNLNIPHIADPRKVNLINENKRKFIEKKL